MSNNKNSLFRNAATLALCLAVLAAPAQAGFQWVAPNEGAPHASPAMDSYAASPPFAVEEPEAVSPLVISGTPESLSKAAEPTYPAKTPKEASKIDLSTATISMAPSSAGTQAPTASVVKGFATQVPLALALRQLLPSGYNFSIDQGVDIDTLVSYKGGKPWDETLKSTLASVGLVGHTQGAVVTVSRADIPAPAVVVEKRLVLPPSAAPRTTYAASAAAPSPVPSFNVSSPDGWTAERGDTLHKVLMKWCTRAGVELKWIAEYDYPVEASAHFKGGFEDAVRNLLAGFDNARPQPIGELHTNPYARQKVLVIQVRGNSYSN